MRYTFEASAFLSRDNGRRSAEEYKALLNAMQPLPHAWLSYLSLGWLRNSFQNFDAKVDMSIGLGKVLYKSRRISFLLKAGPAVNYEAYSSGGERNYASLNEYIEYRRKVRSDSTIYLKSGARENFAQMRRDYEINTLVGLRVEVAKKMHLVTEYNYRYDNTPSEGYGKRDTMTVIRLGYRF
jgi:putative salt-induced outer membrane protein YdiY